MFRKICPKRNHLHALERIFLNGIRHASVNNSFYEDIIIGSGKNKEVGLNQHYWGDGSSGTPLNSLFFRNIRKYNNSKKDVQLFLAKSDKKSIIRGLIYAVESLILPHC